jgi:HK97 family phage major capsid protein
MDTLELIDIVTKNHKAVLEHHAKTDKTLEEIPARLTDLEQKVARRGGPATSYETKSWGATIIESEEFKEFCGLRGPRKTSNGIEIKTVNTIGSGATLAGPMIAPMVITDPTILPRRRMTIRNLLAPGQTNSNAVWFPRMTARQNNAATVVEQALKPQSDVTMELIATPVVTIAHFMKAAKQALDDAPALSSLIDSELKYGLSFTEEIQLLLGDGTGANLLGLIPQATAYAAPFAIADGETILDRIALAILQSELSFLPANGVVINNSDWTKAKLLKDGMGRYILGAPNDAAPPMLWGLPVVPTTAMTAGTFLVGAFEAAAQIFDRQNVIVELSTENEDDFIKNKVTIRCEERLALAVKQPLALITGMLP